jgi:hypothetical protein
VTDPSVQITNAATAPSPAAISRNMFLPLSVCERTSRVSRRSAAARYGGGSASPPLIARPPVPEQPAGECRMGADSMSTGPIPS